MPVEYARQCCLLLYNCLFMVWSLSIYIYVIVYTYAMYRYISSSKYRCCYIDCTHFVYKELSRTTVMAEQEKSEKLLQDGIARETLRMEQLLGEQHKRLSAALEEEKERHVEMVRLALEEAGTKHKVCVCVCIWYMCCVCVVYVCVCVVYVLCVCVVYVLCV